MCTKLLWDLKSLKYQLHCQKSFGGYRCMRLMTLLLSSMRLNFRRFLLQYLTKLYVTLSNAIAPLVKYLEICQSFSYSAADIL